MTVTISGTGLTIAAISAVSHGEKVRLSTDAAVLGREQLEVLEHYLALALLCATQAVELRASQAAATYAARAVLSPGTRALYEAARTAAAGPPDAARPLHWNDLDEFIQPKVEGVLADIAAQGSILRAVSGVTESLRERSR
jgi:phenylalanine ammonia-lyase